MLTWRGIEIFKFWRFTRESDFAVSIEGTFGVAKLLCLFATSCFYKFSSCTFCGNKLVLFTKFAGGSFYFFGLFEKSESLLQSDANELESLFALFIWTSA